MFPEKVYFMAAMLYHMIEILSFVLELEVLSFWKNERCHGPCSEPCHGGAHCRAPLNVRAVNEPCLEHCRGVGRWVLGIAGALHRPCNAGPLGGNIQLAEILTNAIKNCWLDTQDEKFQRDNWPILSCFNTSSQWNNRMKVLSFINFRI